MTATLHSTPFGRTRRGEPVERWELRLPSGASAAVLTRGATLQQVRVPELALAVRRHEGDGAHGARPGDHRHDHVRLDAELANEPEVLAVLRGGRQRGLRDVEHDLGATRADHPGRADEVVSSLRAGSWVMVIGGLPSRSVRRLRAHTVRLPRPGA